MQQPLAKYSQGFIGVNFSERVSLSNPGSDSNKRNINEIMLGYIINFKFIPRK